ncbi:MULTISPECIES: hypothetical protein [Agrobacterium]|uniref:hypothetical protein n=1 Tax=Agrobacterium tumefaciens TaxID=358 RepID=UPI000EF1A1DC|nr:hypothetical protein At1D1108_50300 [Agrobacterium tumefaciens]NSY09778.1 hypothetical protein [Agrobacterium tumefaciens]NSY93365.1 hypothetical protein [Agrobacterium tumefaciens]
MVQQALRKLPTAILKPYLSAGFLRLVSKGKPAKALQEFATQIVELTSDANGRKFRESFAVSTTAGLTIQAHVYVNKRLSPWASGEFYDETNELVVIAVRNDLVAIVCSESSMRERLTKKIAIAKPLKSDLLERAFVGSQAKAMWLTGVHTPTAAKASAKSMTGPALELALDPLGDQTFYYSAVKSSGAFDGKTVIGAAPSSSRIWVNRPKDWKAFTTTLSGLIDHIATTEKGSSVAQPWLQVLAQTVGEASTATDPYAVALISPELLAEDTIDQATRERAIAWAYESELTVLDHSGPSPRCRVSLGGTEIGSVEITIAGAADRSYASATWSDQVEGCQLEREQCSQLIERPECLRIYYADGTTLADGRLFTQAYRDQRFDWDFRDFANYAVDKEKPKLWGGKALADVIASQKEDGTNDDSLFAYVIEKLFPAGWLASDDGSMEFADFVHINPAGDHVTLIHAKGSNKTDVNRGVSVSNYEVVVGQAVKNVRHLDRNILADILAGGKHKKIGGAVWLDGIKQNDRVEIIEAAKALKPDHIKTVIVLQPQLTETERQACIGPSPTATGDRIKRMKQLDTLMLSARLSCGAVGASFIGIGAK